MIMCSLELERFLLRSFFLLEGGGVFCVFGAHPAVAHAIKRSKEISVEDLSPNTEDFSMYRAPTGTARGSKCPRFSGTGVDVETRVWRQRASPEPPRRKNPLSRCGANLSNPKTPPKKPCKFLPQKAHGLLP